MIRLTIFLCLIVAQPIVVSADVVFLAEVGFGDTISTHDTASHSTSIVHSHPGQDPRTIAIDRVHKKIYYSHGTTIVMSNYDGTGRSDIVFGVSVGDIEVDPVNGKIYFSVGSGTLADRAIKSANLDGSGVTTIHSNASLLADPLITVNNVFNLSIDTENDLLYWTADDGGNAGRKGLNVSTTTGGSVGQLWKATSRLDAIDKMEIDFDSSKLYYTVGSVTAEVRRSNLNNSSLESLVSGVGRPGAITLNTSGNEMFFMVGSELHRSKLDGTGRSSHSLNGSTLYHVSDMEFLSSVPEPASATSLILLGTLLAMRRRRRSN